MAAYVPATVRVDARVGRRTQEGVVVALRSRERVLLVSLGANDADAPGPFRVRVRRVLQRRACVAWLAVPSRPRLTRVLRQEARRDGRLRVVGVGGVRLSDGVHPGPAGYRALARRGRSACSSQKSWTR